MTDLSKLDEARMIWAGTTMLQPEREHIEALIDYHEQQIEAYECRLIRIAAQLDQLKQGEVLGG